MSGEINVFLMLLGGITVACLSLFVYYLREYLRLRKRR